MLIPKICRPVRAYNFIGAQNKNIEEDPKESLKLCPFTLLKILRKNLGYGLTKYNSCKNWSPMTIASAVNGSETRRPSIGTFPENFCAALKLNFGWTGLTYGYNVLVHGECYRVMINDFSEPELEEIYAKDLWCQKTGATYNPFVEGNFVAWPPRSCDVTPLSFWESELF